MQLPKSNYIVIGLIAMSILSRIILIMIKNSARDKLRPRKDTPTHVEKSYLEHLILGHNIHI